MKITLTYHISENKNKLTAREVGQRLLGEFGSHVRVFNMLSHASVAEGPVFHATLTNLQVED